MLFPETQDFPESPNFPESPDFLDSTDFTDPDSPHIPDISLPTSSSLSRKLGAWCFYYDIVISIIVYVLIGFGAVGYLWAYIMLRCFKPYLPEEDLHAHDESVLLHEVDKDLDEESGDTDNDVEQTVDDAPANDTETDAADESAEE